MNYNNIKQRFRSVSVIFLAFVVATLPAKFFMVVSVGILAIPIIKESSPLSASIFVFVIAASLVAGVYTFRTIYRLLKKYLVDALEEPPRVS